MSRLLRKLDRTSLREQVVNAIRDAIVQGKYRPGEKVPELELAEQLGVSRTPIREAIRILEQQGLVDIRPKNGTFVTELNWDAAQDSLRVRAALEEMAVRQAIERLSGREWDELCGKLRRLLDDMGRAVGRDDAVAATELDVQWHTLLIDAARNGFLARAWHMTGLPYLIWTPEREMYPLTPNEWEDFHAGHQTLLEALEERDPDRCADAVRTHIRLKIRALVERNSQTRAGSAGA